MLLGCQRVSFQAGHEDPVGWRIDQAFGGIAGSRDSHRDRVADMRDREYADFAHEVAVPSPSRHGNARIRRGTRLELSSDPGCSVPYVGEMRILAQHRPDFLEDRSFAAEANDEFFVSRMNVDSGARQAAEPARLNYQRNTQSAHQIHVGKPRPVPARHGSSRIVQAVARRSCHGWKRRSRLFTLH